MEQARNQGALWGGIILITLGILFLLDRMHVVAFWWIFRDWWPSLLILMGLVQLVTRPRRWTGPLVLITVGVIFQIDRLDLFWWWSMRRMWPLILIAVGVGILFSRFQGRPWQDSGNAPLKS